MKKVDGKRLGPLMHKYGGKCCYCGNSVHRDGPIDSTFVATRDHDVPKARLTEFTPADNIVLACRLCNNIKGDMTGEEFKYLLETGQMHRQYMEWLAKKTLAALRGRVHLPKMPSPARALAQDRA